MEIIETPDSKLSKFPIWKSFRILLSDIVNGSCSTHLFEIIWCLESKLPVGGSETEIADWGCSITSLPTRRAWLNFFFFSFPTGSFKTSSHPWSIFILGLWKPEQLKESRKKNWQPAEKLTAPNSVRIISPLKAFTGKWFRLSSKGKSMRYLQKNICWLHS